MRTILPLLPEHQECAGLEIVCVPYLLSTKLTPVLVIFQMAFCFWASQKEYRLNLSQETELLYLHDEIQKAVFI
ncbi:hypothetical protein LVJ78_00540 [Uruburuella suis]|jgi:hypothetical protein|uniref:Uncharacterized protein n=1 Tax=Uruburuella suis TaxID=252130 RepID=A0AAE9KH36_9NEIS|nr:hypothetical protein [Uruburuella suis]TCP06476.1 hypothetical protein EV680_11130 [Uruburuella suis]UOO79559.1 hypothetical protein LVJ78_00540 [Uruburuella suis]